MLWHWFETQWQLLPLRSPNKELSLTKPSCYLRFDSRGANMNGFGRPTQVMVKSIVPKLTFQSVDWIFVTGHA